MTAYILDTETTGTDNPHMTEFAYSIVAINKNGLQVVQKPKSKRYNPDKPISYGAMATSHICDEDVADCPPHTDFYLPTGVKYLIGHNIDFDMQVLRNAGVKHTPRLICTQAMARHLLPELDSHKLTALLYYFHYDIARTQAKNAHAAEIDIYFTQLVLESLIGLAIDKGNIIDSMEALYQFSELARIPTHFAFGKYKGRSIKDVANTDKGYLQWTIGNVADNPYLIKVCQQALGE